MTLFGSLIHITGHRLKGLCKISKNVVDMLDPHRQPHITGCDTGITLIPLGQL